MSQTAGSSGSLPGAGVFQQKIAERYLECCGQGESADRPAAGGLGPRSRSTRSSQPQRPATASRRAAPAMPPRPAASAASASEAAASVGSSASMAPIRPSAVPHGFQIGVADGQRRGWSGGRGRWFRARSGCYGRGGGGSCRGGGCLRQMALQPGYDGGVHRLVGAGRHGGTLQAAHLVQRLQQGADQTGVQRPAAGADEVQDILRRVGDRLDTAQAPVPPSRP